jgi:tetratricopeptide (TPR) repeat protein
MSSEPSPDSRPGEEAQTTREGRAGRLAVITSLVSLAVALFGTGFTVLRANVEDQSKLRTELMETTRLLSAIKPGPATSNERAAVLAQIAQIIERVEDVPSSYYRRLGQAFEAQLRFPDAIEHLRRSITMAVDERSPVDAVASHRALAHVYLTVGDVAGMRKEYESALSVDATDRMSAAALKQLAPVTLALSASSEASFGYCDLARAAYKKAVDGVRAVPASMQRAYLQSVDTSAKSSVEACGGSTAKSAGQ